MDEIPITKKDYSNETQPLISSKVSWHSLEYSQLEIRLSTDFKNGLSDKRAQDLQSRYGKNVLGIHQNTSVFSKILKQFKNPLVFVLLVAGILTLALGSNLDATVIALALIFNVSIGAIQEERSSRAFKKLQESQEKYTTVIRDGKKRLIKSEEIVIGDIVILESGKNIPADIRILESNDLSTNEAPLTGEWVAVQKKPDLLKENVLLIEQDNMVWAGTLVVSGFAKGVVVETGVNTQIGEIAEVLSQKDFVKTPIQVNISKIAKFLTYVIIASILLIFGLGILRGEPVVEMILVAVAVAVSAVPEGLPAVVTVVLAIGMERILKEKGLVRNILTAETLGSTTVIITDKTGTLTEARMSLEGLVSTESLDGKCGIEDMTGCNVDLLRMGVLSSDAYAEENVGPEGEIVVHGRPIEKAIVLAGISRGISGDVLIQKYPRIDFMAFSSENRFAVSLNKEGGMNRMYFTGAPEHLLELSTKLFKDGKIIEFDNETRARFIDSQNKMSRDGMRVTAVAFKNTRKDSIPREKGVISGNESKDLVFVGMLIFGDPVRADVPDAIKEAQLAGARVIMATGDNPETAKAIAIKVGIATTSTKVYLGRDIEDMDEKDLAKLLNNNSVFARVLPSQKLKMVNTLRNSGEIVAMTGDGINDAPALKSSDIGIVVGSGTDVAKEASDLILLDNNFSIIVSAIREGRRIIDNLKRIISHLLSTSFSGILLIAGTLILGFPLPILPAQILWHNIIEEGILNFAFAFEPAEKGIMKRKPSANSAYNLLSDEIKKLIFTIASITAVFVLIIFIILIKSGVPIEEVRTMMFVTLSLDATFFIFSLKSFTKPIWKINLLSNKVLFFSFLLTITMLVSSIVVVPLRNILQLTTLSAIEVSLLVGVAIFNLLLIETAKYFIFWKQKKPATIEAHG